MLIDKDQVIAELTRICTEEPDRVNPVDGSTCVYTTEDGQDHCIAGQVVLNLTNVVIPLEVNGYFPDLVNGTACLDWSFEDDILFAEDAVQLLGEAQSSADGVCIEPESGAHMQIPRPWGLVAYELGLADAPLNTVQWNYARPALANPSGEV